MTICANQWTYFFQFLFPNSELLLSCSNRFEISANPGKNTKMAPSFGYCYNEMR